jgi:hypothetical protein
MCFLSPPGSGTGRQDTGIQRPLLALLPSRRTNLQRNVERLIERRYELRRNLEEVRAALKQVDVELSWSERSLQLMEAVEAELSEHARVEVSRGDDPKISSLETIPLEVSVIDAARQPMGVGAWVTCDIWADIRSLSFSSHRQTPHSSGRAKMVSAQVSRTARSSPTPSHRGASPRPCGWTT